MAARLEEGIAEPGGVAVSAAMRDNVGNRLALKFSDLGEQVLKNIDRPVRVYSVRPDEGEARQAPRRSRAMKQNPKAPGPMRRSGTWRRRFA